MTRGQRGRGSLYLRGKTWWVKYYVNGRPYRESTKANSLTAATRLLARRLADAARGYAPDPQMRRLTVSDLLRLVADDYQANGRKSLKRLQTCAAHLFRHFAKRPAMSLTMADLTGYASTRQRLGGAPATVKLELSMLGRGFQLAVRAGLLASGPAFPTLRVQNVRTGFFEPEQVEAVRRHLRPEYRAVVNVAYALGWRIPSEVLRLERRQLDLDAGTLRLDPGTTKNDDGRLVYLTEDLREDLAIQVERVRALERRLGRIIPWLFPHLRGRYLGQRTQDFPWAWRKACRRAGLPGMLRHDFRRTAVRNMVNAGVPERVAMQVTGHKTRSIFDRYHIVTPRDLQEVARTMTGTISGTSRRQTERRTKLTP